MYARFHIPQKSEVAKYQTEMLSRIVKTAIQVKWSN